MTKRNEILNHLEKHTTLSMLELKLLTGISSSSIRARISDLKKSGYQISYDTIPSHKYVLSPDNPLLTFLEKNNLFNRPFSIEKISKSLHMTPDELTTQITKLFKEHKVIQISSDSILIRKSR